MRLNSYEDLNISKLRNCDKKSRNKKGDTTNTKELLARMFELVVFLNNTYNKRENKTRIKI